MLFKEWLEIEEGMTRRNFLGGAVAAGVGMLGRKAFGDEPDDKEADKRFNEIQARFNNLRKPSNKDMADAKAKAENHYRQNAVKYQGQNEAEIKIVLTYWFLMDAIMNRLITTLKLKEDKIKVAKFDIWKYKWVKENYPDDFWKASDIPIYERFKKVIALSFEEELRAKEEAHAYGKGDDYFGGMVNDLKKINGDLDKMRTLADKVRQNIEEEKAMMRKHGMGKFVDDYEHEEMSKMLRDVEKMQSKYQREKNVSGQELNKDQIDLLDILKRLEDKKDKK